MEPRQPASDRKLLETAGEAIGLLAGAVALVYLLGGLIYALRLAFGGFEIEAIVAVVGQLPREALITAGLVEAIGPALLVGTLAALGSGAVRRPKPRTHRTQRNDDRLTKGKPVRFFAMFAALTVALVSPAVLLALGHEELSIEYVTALVGVAVTYVMVCAGWYALRRIGRRDWARLWRALAAGGIWAGMALTPAVMFGAAVVFEPVRVCVRDSAAPQGGELIAETKERVLVATGAQDRRAVVSLPTARIQRVEYGELDETTKCPPAAPAQ